jgi:hypothetical protein
MFLQTSFPFQCCITSQVVVFEILGCRDRVASREQVVPPPHVSICRHSNLSSECLFHHQPRCQPCTIRSLLLRVHAVVCSAFVASPVSTERSGSCDEWFVFTCTTPGCMREQPTLEVELALQMSPANKISSPDTSESSECFH